MAKIKFLAIGGQDERGKSCFVVEVNDDIYVFNAGAKLPSNEMFGINMIVADYTYLEENIERVKGIFIGTPNYFNVMGLKLLIAKTKGSIPIYTNQIGSVVIKKIFETKNQNKKIQLNINEMEPVQDKKIGNIFVTAFKIANSLPNSYGFVLKTPDGAVVYVDEFIISNDRNKTFDSQINVLPSITKNNTLTLIMGIGQAGNSALTTPSHKPKNYYEKVLASTSGRMFVGCYNNDAYTIFALASIAKQHNRPFIILSSSFINIFNSATKNKIFNTKNLISLPVSEINNTKNAIVVIVENQDNLYNKLHRIIAGEEKNALINENDSLTLGVVVTPGFELLVARLSDEVSRRDIPFNLLPKDILNMQQSDEDIKLLINLLQPRYVIPVNGLYKNETKFISAATSSWLKEEQIIRVQNGEQFVVENKELNSKPNIIKLEEKYLSNSESIDVGAGILYERAQMAESGIVNLVLLFDKQHQKLLDYIDFDYYGVANNTESVKNQILEIRHIFKERIGECLIYDENKRLDLKETKNALKRLLARLFEKKFGKRPLVLPTVFDCFENDKKR